MVIRANNSYSEGARKGLKEARNDVSWCIEVNLLRIIEGKGLRWWLGGNWDDALFSVENPS